MSSMLRTASAIVLFLGLHVSASAQAVPAPSAFPVPLRTDVPRLPTKQRAKMDRDLLEVTIGQLHALYARHRYTVEQVTRWYLDRIARL